MKRTIVLAWATLIVTGCASDSWLYPTFNADDQRTLVYDGAKISAVPSTADDARNMVFGLTAKLNEARRHRSDAQIVARELLFYGSLLAVGGVAVSSIALRNVGAGIAAGSVALSNHYEPGVQATAFDRGAQRMRCAKDLLDPIDPALLDALPADARDKIPVPTMALYASVPRTVNVYVERVSQDLRVALNAVTLSAPSQQDLMSSVNSYTDAKKKTEDDTKNLNSLVSAKVESALLANDTAAVALAASAASAAKAAADASRRLVESASIQGQTVDRQSDAFIQATKAADAAVAAAALATSATLLAAAAKPAACVRPPLSDISPTSSLEYRACEIRRKTPEEQGELALAFGQAVGTLSEQLELCLKTNQQ
ncbi:hypothetical protein PQR67_35590 [Paraburkholderia fungorum]|uniref:hypothetical protein n=1 Tax=Paraburkholderia fungorum TaxID=134537 RepID=UPI0038BB80C9